MPLSDISTENEGLADPLGSLTSFFVGRSPVHEALRASALSQCRDVSWGPRGPAWRSDSYPEAGSSSADGSTRTGAVRTDRWRPKMRDIVECCVEITFGRSSRLGGCGRAGARLVDEFPVDALTILWLVAGFNDEMRERGPRGSVPVQCPKSTEISKL